jgi:hypothetical protein
VVLAWGGPYQQLSPIKLGGFLCTDLLNVLSGTLNTLSQLC